MADSGKSSLNGLYSNLIGGNSMMGGGAGIIGLTSTLPLAASLPSVFQMPSIAGMNSLALSGFASDPLQQILSPVLSPVSNYGNMGSYNSAIMSAYMPTTTMPTTITTMPAYNSLGSSNKLNSIMGLGGVGGLFGQQSFASFGVGNMWNSQLSPVNQLLSGISLGTSMFGMYGQMPSLGMQWQTPINSFYSPSPFIQSPFIQSPGGFGMPFYSMGYSSSLPFGYSFPTVQYGTYSYNSGGQQGSGSSFRFNVKGYDTNGYNTNGIHEFNYNSRGYVVPGCKDGYDMAGFDKTGTYAFPYDKNGVNRGYNPGCTDCYNKEGFDLQGIHAFGYDQYGNSWPGRTPNPGCTDCYDKNGYNRLGEHPFVYGENGNINRNCRPEQTDCYDYEGCNRERIHVYGFDENGNPQPWCTDCYNSEGYDNKGKYVFGYGYDEHGNLAYKGPSGGYDKEGYDQGGHNKDGYDKAGYKDGYDEQGYNRNGIHKTCQGCARPEYCPGCLKQMSKEDVALKGKKESIEGCVNYMPQNIEQSRYDIDKDGNVEIEEVDSSDYGIDAVDEDKDEPDVFVKRGELVVLYITANTPEISKKASMIHDEIRSQGVRILLLNSRNEHLMTMVKEETIPGLGERVNMAYTIDHVAVEVDGDKDAAFDSLLEVAQKYNNLTDRYRIVRASPNICGKVSALPPNVPSDPTFTYPSVYNPLDSTAWFNPIVFPPIVWGLQWNLHNDAAKPIRVLPASLAAAYGTTVGAGLLTNQSTLLGFNTTTPLLLLANPAPPVANPLMSPVAPPVGTINADIDAFEAWAVKSSWSSQNPLAAQTIDANPIVVAVIDKGIDTNHEDLTNRVVAGYDFVNLKSINSLNPGVDPAGHGTAVAGVICAQAGNFAGIAGINPSGVRVMPLRISGLISEVVDATDWAIANGARVINLSWNFGPVPDLALQSAIQKAGLNDMLVVTGAGNDGLDLDLYPSYPGSFPDLNLICAASTDNLDNLGSFSNYGANTVDLAAPGQGVYTTWSLWAPYPEVIGGATYFVIGFKYVQQTGCSFASPHVAGAAAFLWSMNPQFTYSQVRDAILSGTEPNQNLAGKVLTAGPTRNAVGGDLNLHRAVHKAYNPTSNRFLNLVD
ncbi:MAG: S8 family serine peptidase [Pseudomonadota bacterium]